MGPINYFLIYKTSICYPSCPPGQYQNATSFRCLLCSGQCETCETNSTNCLSCSFSLFGADLFFFFNKCVLTCPGGYWSNKTSHYCDSCDVGCSICTNSGLNACSSCRNASNGTIYYKHIGATTCGLGCPDGQYISAGIPNLCQPCSSACITCASNPENCTNVNCSLNFFFLNNSCLRTCPDNYYPNSTLRQCIQCDQGCQTCYASGLNACTRCNSLANGTQYYLQIGIDICSSSCMPG